MQVGNGMSVYCIIVTYNAMKWVDKCLGSLRESSCPVVPVIIDNCSKDETVSYIKEHYPEAHLIINKENKGFGQANNQGIEWAYKQGAEHFFLLNQDTNVDPEAIEKLVKVQDLYDIDVVSPIHLNGDGTKYDEGFFSYTVMRERNIEYVSDLSLGKQKDFYKVKYINAAAWMISRKTVETIGGFDPFYFQYGEDVNYTQRLSYHRKELAFVPGAFICHDRVLHGNSFRYEKKIVTRRLRDLHADINRKIFQIDRKNLSVHANNLGVFFSALFNLRLLQVLCIIRDFIISFTELPAIMRSRRQNVIETHNWLNI